MRFNQPSSASSTLNRVLSSDPSQIYGKLSANGQVILVNPNGIVVGPTGTVNTAGAILSTHALSDSDYLAGKRIASRRAIPAPARIPRRVIRKPSWPCPPGCARRSPAAACRRGEHLWPHGFWVSLFNTSDFADHKIWGLMLLVVIAWGPGRLSPDALFMRIRKTLGLRGGARKPTT